jgi:hypothetical protein
MNLIETKKVKVGDRVFPVRITARSMINYEELTGKSISTIDGTKDILQFFYVTAKAGAKSEGTEFKYTFEQFLDLIDDYYTEAITNFSEAIFQPGGEGKKQIIKSSK